MLASGKISDFPSPGGANTSYTMTIPTPQLSCIERVVDISETNGVFDDGSTYHFSVDWIRQSSALVMPNLTITSVERLQWVQIPKEDDSNSNDTWIPLGNATLLVCQPALSQLVLNVTYVEETRDISYRKENTQDFIPKLGFSLDYQEREGENHLETPESKDWAADVKEAARIWNVWALLDAALQAMEFKCRATSIMSQTPAQDPSMKNGTVVTFDDCMESGQFKPVAMWSTSVLIFDHRASIH